jgi:drug/metabolite transporter (DMT)-like permease
LFSILNNFFNFSLVNFSGELAALTSACLWAVSSVIYGRVGQRIPPLELNIFKGAIAIALLICTLILQNSTLTAVTPATVGLLLLSGVLGIGIGDTAFFFALNYMGTRRALLMETLSPPLAAILALILLQERLSFSACCGILLAILGVAWVITEQVPNLSERPTHTLRGVGFGIVAAIALASGAVVSRAVFASSGISPLWAAFIRLCGGVLVLLPGGWLRQRQRHFQFFSLNLMTVAAIGIAAFVGTYLGIWLQQVAVKYADVGVALTLSNTSPLFVIPIAIYLGEKISLRAILGVFIALGGVAVLLLLR